MQTAFIRFVLGDRSTEVLDAMQADGLRWADQTGDRPLPLHRLMGLVGPRAMRRDMRDELMLEAFDLLAGTPWARCKELAEAARTFNVRR